VTSAAPVEAASDVDVQRPGTWPDFPGLNTATCFQQQAVHVLVLWVLLVLLVLHVLPVLLVLLFVFA